VETGSRVRFPAVLKPRSGAGSREVNIVGSQVEFEQLARGLRAGYLLQAMVEGPEYSVDCFASADGELSVCSPRERQVVEHGQCIVGRPVSDPELVDLCRVLANGLSFRGVVNFQFIRDSAGPWLIDVNPRFPGGISLTEAVGFGFCDRAIQNLSV
ncbi:MAG: ATP-grasp domain-containing protein, partial [Sedimenticolaceae bacterium]